MGYNAFTTWLSDYMERNHLTQEGLAEKLGVKHPTVGSWLRGKHPPEPASLNKLAELSNQNPIVLFKMVGYLPDSADENIPADRPKLTKLVRQLEDLQDRYLEMLSNQVKFVIVPLQEGDESETSKRISARHNRGNKEAAHDGDG